MSRTTSFSYLGSTVLATFSTTVRERLRAILECDVSAALANVHVPLLCLTAKDDRLIPNAAAQLIRRQRETPHLAQPISVSLVSSLECLSAHCATISSTSSAVSGV